MAYITAAEVGIDMMFVDNDTLLYIQTIICMTVKYVLWHLIRVFQSNMIKTNTNKLYLNIGTLRISMAEKK
jgi:hypothetical protein